MKIVTRVFMAMCVKWPCVHWYVNLGVAGRTDVRSKLNNLIASLLLVAMPGATRLVASLLLVVLAFVTTSVLATCSNARSY